MLSHAFGVPHRLVLRLYGAWSVPFRNNFACRPPTEVWLFLNLCKLCV